MNSQKKTIKAIKTYWKSIDFYHYWGDNIDIRYFIITKLLQITGKKILDIGCGPGAIISFLSPSNTKFGIDIDETDLKIASKLNPDFKAIKADFNELPFINNSFDIIFIIGIINITPNYKVFLSKVNQLLKPDGKLFIMFFNKHHSNFKVKLGFLGLSEIEEALKPYYKYNIIGYNPLPKFPFFVPNCIVDKIPFIWNILFFLANNKYFFNNSIAFFIEANKASSD